MLAQEFRRRLITHNDALGRIVGERPSELH